MTAQPAIRVRDLARAYGAVQALRGIELDVQAGEVFALLGPNGAGKTTTVEILEGHRTRDRGEAMVLGFDPGIRDRAFRERIGIVLQSTGVERFLTVAEVIELHAGYYPRRRGLDEILSLTGLAEVRDRRIGRLSGGLRRRVDLAVALAGDPDLLFLDEPTTGFDPSARRQAWETVRGLAALGKTILLTTHYLDEAEALADRVAIIVDGRIVAEGSPRELIARASRASRIRFTLADGAELPERLGVRRTDGMHELETDAPLDTLAALHAWSHASGTEVRDLEVSRCSHEDVYLELAGGEAGTE